MWRKRSQEEVRFHVLYIFGRFVHRSVSDEEETAFLHLNLRWCLLVRLFFEAEREKRSGGVNVSMQSVKDEMRMQKAPTYSAEVEDLK